MGKSKPDSGFPPIRIQLQRLEPPLQCWIVQHAIAPSSQPPLDLAAPRSGMLAQVGIGEAVFDHPDDRHALRFVIQSGRDRAGVDMSRRAMLAGHAIPDVIEMLGIR